MKVYYITEQEQNQRLDKFLQKYLNNAEKNFIYKMLRKKNIKLNGAKAAGNEMLAVGDAVQIYFSEETLAKFTREKTVNARAGDIDIVYEDDLVLAVNKPAGILTHPDGDEKDTVVDRILLYLYQNKVYDTGKEGVFTPGVCNRLDRNTSGLILCGKTLAAVQSLNETIAGNGLDKYYLTIVKGRIDRAGNLSGYHRKDRERNTVAVNDVYIEGGKEIRTEFAPVAVNDSYTLLKVQLVTGKSHQIRAHLSSIGHPIIGDGKYGDKTTNQYFKEKFKLHRQLLHAYTVAFKNPVGSIAYLKGKELKATLPEDFERIQNTLF